MKVPTIRLKAPEGAESCRGLDGQLYHVKNGILEIPADQMPLNVWGLGYTRADAEQAAPARPAAGGDLKV